MTKIRNPHWESPRLAYLCRSLWEIGVAVSHLRCQNFDRKYGNGSLGACTAKCDQNSPERLARCWETPKPLPHTQKCLDILYRNEVM